MKSHAFRRWSIALGILGMVALTGWATVGADEKQLTLDEVPAAVKATILREAGKGKINEIERDNRGDKLVYEAEILLDGDEFDIIVAPDGTLLGREGDAPPVEQEREVTADEVPDAAMMTLLKLAGDAAFTEFAEEIEHGGTFYEGSWVGKAGMHVDALVTARGDLVEIEEGIGPDDVPAAVRKVAGKAAGDAGMKFERKTMILYEVKFRKGGKYHEVLLTPDGRILEREQESAGEEGDEEGGDADHDDEDEDEDDDDDDD